MLSFIQLLYQKDFLFSSTFCLIVLRIVAQVIIDSNFIFEYD